jgi:transposase
MDQQQEKEAILSEYLSGGTSTRRLGVKYGYGNSTIWRWIMAEKKQKSKRDLLQASKLAELAKENLPTEVKQLQEELRNAQLKICLLEAMIEISDEQFGTEIRKKAGTRPS